MSLNLLRELVMQYLIGFLPYNCQAKYSVHENKKKEAKIIVSL